jgi:hypothetical protein
MTDLTNEARALLGSLWINPKFTLRYAMVESVPSPKAETALKELVSAGVLNRKEGPTGDIVFSLSEAGAAMDRKPKGGTAFLKRHGSFPLAVSRETPNG